MAEFAIVLSIVIVAVWFLIKKVPPSNCNHNCNQGRNCDCGPNKKEHNIEWKKTR